MNLKPNFLSWLRVPCLACLMTGAAAFADSASASAPTDPEVIVSTVPMKLGAEGAGVHGQFVVAPEILGAEAGNDLIYTITAAPLFGRVGLAGGDDEDFFQNQRGRSGYFAYQPRPDYVGEDSFTYTVRNETSGLVYQNKVVVDVKPAPPVVLEKLVVTGAREHVVAERAVVLTTRPNTVVTHKVPSHEDFMPAGSAPTSPTRSSSMP